VSFAVPTGNFGDAYAGHAAATMGLPIRGIIIATNSNDIVARALAGGRLARGRATATLSPAMDIQVASNFERLWFDASGADAKATAAALRAFEAKGRVDIPPATLERMRALFSAAAVDEALTLATMRETFEESGVIIDPHTAVALAAARADGEEHPREPMVVLATAHPAKFPEAVSAAIGLEPPAPPRVVRVLALAERFNSLPADVEAVKAYVRAAP
jgi:threonine synthase